MQQVKVDVLIVNVTEACSLLPFCKVLRSILHLFMITSKEDTVGIAFVMRMWSSLISYMQKLVVVKRYIGNIFRKLHTFSTFF